MGREVRQRVGRVRANLLLEQDEGGGGQIRRQHVAVERRIGACEQQYALTLGRERVGLLAHGVVGRARGPDHLRRTKDPRAVLAERGRAPLAGGGERHRTGARPAGWRGERRAQRRGGRVAVLVGREGAERVVDRRSRVEGLDPVVGDRAFGERPGLVEADDVDAGEALDRGQLLHEHVAAGQRDCRDREREARQQHQALGNHRHDTGDNPRHRLPPPFVRAELAEREQRRRRHQGIRDVAQDRVDPVHQLRTHEREPPGLRCEPPRVRIVADTRRLEATAAGHHDAAGEHFVVGRLVDGIGLAGEQRLVDLQPVRFVHLAVARDLVTSADVDEVVDDDLLDRDLDALPVADDSGAGRVEDREPVERALGSVLLDDADQRVRDEHDSEQGVLDRPDDQDHHEHRAEDRVEAGEDVGPDDLADRAARALVGCVDQPTRQAVGHFGRTQPVGPGGSRVRSARVEGGVGHDVHARSCPIRWPTWPSTPRSGKATSYSPTAAPCVSVRSGATTWTRSPACTTGSRDETLYLRFFSPVPRPTAVQLERLTEVDYDSRMTLVALLGDEMVAVARYDRVGADEAEVAFVVQDDQQGRGLGTLLLEHLAVVARTNGITTFSADTLPNNMRMLNVFADAGWIAERRFVDGTVRVRFPIEPTVSSIAAIRHREHQAESASTARLLAPRRSRSLARAEKRARSATSCSATCSVTSSKGRCIP